MTCIFLAFFQFGQVGGAFSHPGQFWVAGDWLQVILLLITSASVSSHRSCQEGRTCVAILHWHPSTKLIFSVILQTSTQHFDLSASLLLSASLATHILWHDGAVWISSHNNLVILKAKRLTWNAVHDGAAKLEAPPCALFFNPEGCLYNSARTRNSALPCLSLQM